MWGCVTSRRRRRAAGARKGQVVRLASCVSQARLLHPGRQPLLLVAAPALSTLHSACLHHGGQQVALSHLHQLGVGLVWGAGSMGEG